MSSDHNIVICTRKVREIFPDLTQEQAVELAAAAQCNPEVAVQLRMNMLDQEESEQRKNVVPSSSSVIRPAAGLQTDVRVNLPSSSEYEVIDLDDVVPASQNSMHRGNSGNTSDRFSVRPGYISDPLRVQNHNAGGVSRNSTYYTPEVTRDDSDRNARSGGTGFNKAFGKFIDKGKQMSQKFGEGVLDSMERLAIKHQYNQIDRREREREQIHFTRHLEAYPRQEREQNLYHLGITDDSLGSFAMHPDQVSVIDRHVTGTPINPAHINTNQNHNPVSASASSSSARPKKKKSGVNVPPAPAVPKIPKGMRSNLNSPAIITTRDTGEVTNSVPNPAYIPTIDERTYEQELMKTYLSQNSRENNVAGSITSPREGESPTRRKAREKLAASAAGTRSKAAIVLADRPSDSKDVVEKDVTASLERPNSATHSSGAIPPPLDDTIDESILYDPNTINSNTMNSSALSFTSDSHPLLSQNANAVVNEVSLSASGPTSSAEPAGMHTSYTTSSGDSSQDMKRPTGKGNTVRTDCIAEESPEDVVDDDKGEIAQKPRIPHNAVGYSPVGPGSNERGEDVGVPNLPAHFDIKEGRTLGSGSFGRVFLGQEQSTGALVAVKELKFNMENAKEAQFCAKFRNELLMYQNLRHPNIVAYLGHKVMVSPDRFLIYLEFLPGGSIKQQITDFGALNASLVVQYSHQLLLGVKYLHEQNPVILHRDLKPANLLLTHQGKVKLADFGCSTRLKTDEVSDSLVGSLPYMAPEVISQKGVVGPASDIWSVGCVILEMLTGKHPWSDKNFKNVYQAASYIAKKDSEPTIPESLPEDIVSIIKDCLQRDSVKRPTADNLLKRELFADFDIPEPLATTNSNTWKSLQTLM